MVYLKQIIQNELNLIKEYKNLEYIAYLYLKHPEQLLLDEFVLSPEEEIAFSGYKHVNVDDLKLNEIINKTPKKGNSPFDNIFKLIGFYLISKERFKVIIDNRYKKSDILNKFLIYLFERNYENQLLEETNSNFDDISILINAVLNKNISNAESFNDCLTNIVSNSMNVQTILLLEEVEKVILKIKYINLTAMELINNILMNFSNSIKKITDNRRKDHEIFSINDEYDFQDILYVILKSIFPSLKDEDPIPKQGSKSTKIDLIIREEKILIEAKMIKEKDRNEDKFINELKIDFESYHQCQWLENLICVIYDPYKKTKDNNNFTDLEGIREKNGHKYKAHIYLIN